MMTPLSSSATDLLTTFMLALCIWREARGESMRGKRLVGQVIANRVTDPRWPDDYVGVITQPWQFSAFNKGDPNALKFPSETDPAWPACVEAARMVLEADEPFTDANHYHTTGVSPTWKNDAKVVAREGGHIFYAL